MDVGAATISPGHGMESRSTRLAILEQKRTIERQLGRSEDQKMVVQDEQLEVS